MAPDLATDFDAFARVQHDRILRFANRRLGDWHDAEEVAQETLLRAYQHWDTFDSVDGAAAWCSTVARRLVIDRLRLRPRAVVTAELPEPAAHARSAADVAAARQDAALALDVLGLMPDRQAAVLWARHIEGLSYDSIGQRMSMTEPTVRSLLHRARSSLRTNFVRRGGEIPVGGVLLAPLWARRVLRSLTGPPAAVLAAAGTVGVALVLVPAPRLAPERAAPAAPTRLPAAAQVYLRPDATRGDRPGSARAAGAAAPARSVAPAGAVGTPAGWAQQVCAGGACLSHSHPAQLPGTSLVVRLPAGLRVGGNNQLGVSTSLIGDCPALPANPLVRCGQTTPGGGS